MSENFVNFTGCLCNWEIFDRDVSFRGPRSMNVELGLILPKINVKGEVQSGSDYIPTYLYTDH